MTVGAVGDHPAPARGDGDPAARRPGPGPQADRSLCSGRTRTSPILGSRSTTRRRRRSDRARRTRAEGRGRARRRHASLPDGRRGVREADRHRPGARRYADRGAALQVYRVRRLLRARDARVRSGRSSRAGPATHRERWTLRQVEPDGAATDSRSIRVGLVGFGLGGAVFHAPLIEATPGLTLASIVTTDPDRVARARERYPATRVLPDVETLFASAGDHDLVVVTTPNRSHVPIARSAIEAGLHVVIDKPIAPSAADARRPGRGRGRSRGSCSPSSRTGASTATPSPCGA